MTPSAPAEQANGPQYDPNDLVQVLVSQREMMATGAAVGAAIVKRLERERDAAAARAEAAEKERDELRAQLDRHKGAPDLKIAAG